MNCNTCSHSSDDDSALVHLTALLSAAFSASIMIGIVRKKPGCLGKAEASMTRKFGPCGP
jgi:hypothetical protein